MKLPDEERQWIFQVFVRPTGAGVRFKMLVHQYMERIPAGLLPMSIEPAREFITKEELDLESIMTAQHRLPRFLQFTPAVRARTERRLAKTQPKAEQRVKKDERAPRSRAQTAVPKVQEAAASSASAVGPPAEDAGQMSKAEVQKAQTFVDASK